MEETDMVSPEEIVPPENVHKTSHESLFGFLVTMIIVVFLVLLASYAGWFLYHGVKNSMSDTGRLSIADIPQGTSAAVQEHTSKEANVADAEENKPVASESGVVNRKIAIKVLNGGAAKGSASTVAGLLMGSGYTTVTTGNSIGDYSGVSVYFTAPATQGDADAVSATLLKKYPSSTVKPSVAGNTDTQAGLITVIVGK